VFEKTITKKMIMVGGSNQIDAPKFGR